MATYSFSQIWLYEQCPKKYQFKYLDKYETEFVASYDTVLWNSVHSTLEWLYKEVNVFNEKQPQNIESMSYTSVVLKLDKSNEVKCEQSLNIFLILSAFSVLKLDKSKEINEEHSLNILCISSTSSVLKLDKFK